MSLSIESAAMDISDQHMLLFQRFFSEQTGLHLPLSKKALLCSRLSSHVNELGLSNLEKYYAFICQPARQTERQRAIDLITTNETYFFRESKHFDFLRDQILPALGQVDRLRIWSAASATGEEAYSIAMVLDDAGVEQPWSILATDISQRVLSFARRSLYPMARGERIPDDYLVRYCLCGTGDYEGHFLIDQRLRQRVSFEHCNLVNLPDKVQTRFDVVFLRNVIIYFDFPTKLQVLQQVVQRVKPGGWLLVGHSESLHGMSLDLEMVASAVYRRCL